MDKANPATNFNWPTALQPCWVHLGAQGAQGAQSILRLVKSEPNMLVLSQFPKRWQVWDI
jgi:hypothetical protein